MSVNEIDELKKFLQKLDSPRISLIELSEMWIEIAPIVQKVKTQEAKVIVDEIRKKSQIIIYKFIDKLINKEIEPTEKELKILENSINQLVNVVYSNNLSEEEKILAGENIKKAIDWKLDKGREQSSKKEYPWGIIISMGAVITALLGVIVFLLIKNKNKKNVK